MGRRALEPGEFGKMTMRGKHPRLGLWRAEASLKKEKVRPKLWRAEVRYHDPAQHKVRVLTAEGGGKGEAQASLEAAMRQAKEAEGLDASARHTTVGRAMRLHLEELEGGEIDLAEGTVRAYASVIRKHFLSNKSLIRDVPLVRLTALQIERDMARVVGIAPTRGKAYKAILSAVLAKAVKARVIDEDPMLRVTYKPPASRGKKVYANGSKRRLNRALSAEEEKTMMAQLEGRPEWLKDYVIIMRHTGLRISEVAGIRVQDVDLDAGTLTVAGQVIHRASGGFGWVPTLKSDLSYRTLPLRKQAQEALERRLTAVLEAGGGEYLFVPPRASGPNPKYAGALLREVLDAAGLEDVTPHALRRSMERDLELAGATVSERETYMGHAEEVARRHYADHGSVRPELVQLLEKVDY